MAGKGTLMLSFLHRKCIRMLIMPVLMKSNLLGILITRQLRAGNRSLFEELHEERIRITPRSKQIALLENCNGFIDTVLDGVKGKWNHIWQTMLLKLETGRDISKDTQVYFLY
jgi:hypothetical protein